MNGCPCDNLVVTGKLEFILLDLVNPKATRTVAFELVRKRIFVRQHEVTATDKPQLPNGPLAFGEFQKIEIN